MKISKVYFDDKHRIYYFTIQDFGATGLAIKIQLKLLYGLNSYIDWNKFVIMVESPDVDKIEEVHQKFKGG